MREETSRFFKKITLLFIGLFFWSHSLSAQILTNGNLETGGSGTGFLVHDYTLINPLNGTSNPGFYARTTNPALMNSSFIAGGDHTTGTGNMLVYDGATAANRFFWTTGSTGGAIVGFTAGTTYTFSFWIKSVSNAVTSDVTTRASIGLFFVNANGINPSNQNILAPLPSEGWVKIAYSFVATANNVMVRLKTNTAVPIGNDFAVDDFSIVEGGLPLVGSYTSVNPTCPNINDGSITVNLTGGNLPYSTYNLTGSATISNNNGIFTGLGNGTYSLSVSDSNGQQYSQTNIVLTAPNDLQVSAPATICSGNSTVMTASGGANSYTWTANPPDASLVNPNNASQTVSPNTTTVYTISSGALSSQVNLIENGDFSQGDTLFFTEYTQVDNPNPFGVQSSYNIVTNPNTWFSPFASCGDHTTGTGNLMIFDGATDPTGNIIAWSNVNAITVVPNTNYTFSYYVASAAPENLARLEVIINGVSQGLPVVAPGTTCTWTQVSYIWNSSTNSTANIAIYDRNFLDYGNDFALDDIALRETTTCSYQKTITITVIPTATPVFTILNSVCSGAVISDLPTISNNGFSGTWSPTLNNLATTYYEFTPTPGQCASLGSLTITVVPLPEFSITEGCVASDYTLAATSTNLVNPTYSWYNSAGAPIGSNNPTLIISEAGIYKLIITESGCSSEDTIDSVNPFCEIPTIPKGISVNGDTKNDSLDLNFPSFPIQTLSIINRLGIKVYSLNNYKDEWQGQSDDGEELPDGTYFYSIDFENGQNRTGWVYLIREQ